MIHIRYAIKQIFKRPFINAIVVCQFTAVIMLSALMIQKLNTYFLASSMIKDICDKNSYRIEINSDYSRWYSEKYVEIDGKYQEIDDRLCFQMDSGEIDEQTYKKLYNEQIKEPKKKECSQAGLDDEVTTIDTDRLPYINKEYIEYWCNIGVKTGEAGYDSVNLLSRSYAEDLNIKTAYGKWLDEEDPDDEYIDLVACSDMGHSVGDIVDLKITNQDLQDPLEYDYCKGKIIGIVYKNANEGDYGTTVQRNDMFSVDEILSFQGTDFFAVYPEDDQRLKNNDMFELEKGSIIVTLKEDLTDDERKEFLSTAAKEHYTADSLKEFYDRTYNHDLKLFKNDIVFLTLAFLTAVVALIGVSVLNVAKERRTYSIYCLYGMTTKDCTLINAIYTMMILLASGSISLIVKVVSAYREYADDFEIYERVRREFEAEGLPFINKTIKYSDYFRLQPSYIWLLAGLFVVSFICSMIVPYLSLKKLDIVSEIKQED